MQRSEIERLMAEQNRVIIEVKQYKRHDMVNFWAEPPSPSNPKGLRVELRLTCRLEELPEETVMIHLVGTRDYTGERTQ